MLGISKFDPKKWKENPWFQCDKKLTCLCLHCPPTKQDFNKSCQKLQRKRHSSWHEQSLFFQDKFCGFSYQKNVRKCGKRLLFFSCVNLTNLSFFGKILQILDITNLGEKEKKKKKTNKQNHEWQIKNWTIFFSFSPPPFFLLLLLQSCQVPLVVD